MTRPIAQAPSLPSGQTNLGVNPLSAPRTPANRIAKVDRSQVDPRMVQAAQGMESMFLDYLMKVMRQTVPKNEFDLENSATEVYRGMLDTETANRAAAGRGIGLTDQIIAYLIERSYTDKRADSRTKSDTQAGTNEQPAEAVRGSGGSHESK